MKQEPCSVIRNVVVHQLVDGSWACCSARALAKRPDRHFGKMVSSRGIAPACGLSLVDITAVLGKINTVDVERYYDTERYHLRNIGM
jgi:hypothetical protein